MRFTNIIVSLAALSGITSGDMGSHTIKMKTAILKTKPDGYSGLNEDIREWLESELEKDVQYTKHISRQEVEGINQPNLVFIDENDKEAETLFVNYVPVSMVRDIVKDKKWVGDENEEL